MKVIFVFPHPPTADYCRTFFVQRFKDDGFTIEWWDVGPLLGYDMHVRVDLGCADWVQLGSLGAFEERLRRERGNATVFVIQITRLIRSFPLYRLLRKHDARVVTFARGCMPAVAAGDKTIADIFRWLRDGRRVRERVAAAMYRLLTWGLPVRRYDIAFVAGRVAEETNRAAAVGLCRIHHHDVDLATSDEPTSVRLPERYCVFIDDFLPDHPDFEARGQATVDSGRYYACVRSFFDEVEARLDTIVVVAGHPRGFYETQCFGSRLCVSGQTNALARGAHLVLTHFSTAMSYAVIHHKPLWLLVDPQIPRVHPGTYERMLKTSEVLGCPMVGIGERRGRDLPEALPEAVKYQTYNEDFLSYKVASADSYSIVSRELTRLLSAEREPRDNESSRTYRAAEQS
jgi:hypothetical protein